MQQCVISNLARFASELPYFLKFIKMDSRELEEVHFSEAEENEEETNIS